MNTSGIQSSLLVSNVVGMIPGVETTTSDAALAFFYSISTIVTLILLGFAPLFCQNKYLHTNHIRPSIKECPLY